MARRIVRSALSPWHGALVLAAVFLAAHLATLPASLEDLDSINFALGLRRFDVAQHQPHPPGYPVYIAAGRVVRAALGEEATALAVLSSVAGAFGVLVLWALFARIAPLVSRQWALLASLVTVTCPLYWFTAVRPLSDVPGLAAALGIQALAIAATSDAGVVTAIFLGAVAAGVRSQVAWLVFPLLGLIAVRHRSVRRARFGLLAAAAFLAGLAVWVVPLLALTGGLSAYWQALVDQGTEDLTNIQMLWTTPTAHEAVLALRYAFVAPWAAWPLAAVMLGAAAVGLGVLYRSARESLFVLAVAYGPYLVLDILFQETFTSRYALPVVVPIAYLAAVAASRLPRTLGLVLTLGVAGCGATIAGVSAAGYSSMPAPAFRMLGDMQAAAAEPRGAAPVLAMHRREDFAFRRPIQWLGDAVPRFPRRLAAPPKREWLELVKYWNGGGHDPVWFVADPLRTDLALIDRVGSRRSAYRWPLDYPVLLGGVRPNEMDWHIFTMPGWYLGEGWSLTPETAGLAHEDGRGPGFAPIDGWIRRRPEPVTVMIGGRNLAADRLTARVRLAIDGRMLGDIAAPPGFFLSFVRLPEEALAGAGAYARLSVAASVPQLWIEQFDAQAEDRTMFGFAEGWHEMEYDPATGRSWHWMSERGVIKAHGRSRALRLSMHGETEGFARPTRITVRVGDRVIAQPSVRGQFEIQAQIPAALVSAETAIVIESDQSFVPAERRQRTNDRRQLALRVYDLQVRPAS